MTVPLEAEQVPNVAVQVTNETPAGKGSVTVVFAALEFPMFATVTV